MRWIEQRLWGERGGWRGGAGEDLLLFTCCTHPALPGAAYYEWCAIVQHLNNFCRVSAQTSCSFMRSVMLPLCQIDLLKRSVAH